MTGRHVDHECLAGRAGRSHGKVVIVRGAGRIGPLLPSLLELRDRVGQSHDMLTSPDWFLSRTLMWDAFPVVVLQSVGQVLQSAVLLHVRCWRGIRTGVLKCGDLVGDGGVIAPARDQAFALEQAVKAVLNQGLTHTVVATLRGAKLTEGEGQRLSAPAGTNSWQAREVRRRLDLTGGLDGFLQRQSQKFRRNFRYYRRRAEDGLGCRFLPDLTAEQSIAAVRALHAHGVYPVPARRAWTHEVALRNTPGGFAMGLVDGNGQWLGYLAGWRQEDTAYVEWQLNHGDHEAASLSTVMRSFFVEHEAARGAQSVLFVGGTSGTWERACEPETCFDLLATRNGLMGGMLSTLLARIRPNGQVGSLHRLQASKRP